MKVAIVIGHHKLSKGAFSKYFGLKEYDFYNKYLNELKKYGDVFFHNYLLRGYNARQRSMARKTLGYDLVFELHFNSLDGDTSGCEALYYYRNKDTLKLSKVFCETYTNLTGTRNRGAKPLVSDAQRGFGFVYNQKPPAILLEPFFGDNIEDCKAFDINIFLRALDATINEFKTL